MKGVNKKGLVPYLLLIMTAGILIAGCGDAETAESAKVKEIPIIQENDRDNSVEESEGIFGETEKEPYEDMVLEIKGNKGTIAVGTTGAPFTELLTQAKIMLALEGWDLQIHKYEDHQKLNEDVLNGKLDAHLFAHQTYVDSYNDIHLSNLTSVSGICYEVYGVFSKSNHDLTKIKQGTEVAIPEEPTKKARALLYMQDLGWITLKEDVGITAILDDITQNPHNLKFTEYTADTLETMMLETDYSIVGSDLAIVCGLDLEEDRLAYETRVGQSSNVFASHLIAKEENGSGEKMQILAETLKSPEMKTYVDETYYGAYAVMK